MTIAHRVRLSEAERAELIAIIRRGAASARRITRARVLLLADRGTTDRASADALVVHPRACQRLRQRACQEGVLAALDERPRPGGPTPAGCGPGGAPDRVGLFGRPRWTRPLDDATAG